MARVPSKYPKEPGAVRCGSTYKKGLFVTGEIEGLDFGKQFKKSLGPVVFSDGTANVPLFTSLQNLDEELGSWNGFELRRQATKNAQAKHYKFFTPQSTKSILWLLTQVGNLRSEARKQAGRMVSTAPILGDPVRAKAKAHNALVSALAQKSINSALQFLRCAEYWTWRIIFYGQAREAYKRPFGKTAGPQVPVPAAPPEAELPPPPPPPPPSPPEEETPPEEKKAPPPPKKSKVPYVIGGILAVLVVRKVMR